jgi:hypothetical protein
MEFDMQKVLSKALARGLRGVAVLCAAAALVACGGGDGDKTAPPPFEGPGSGGSDPTTPVASALTIQLSALEVPNDGSSTVTAVVTAVDENRTAVAEIPVTVRVNQGAVATLSDTATNDKGLVTADISVGANRSNRTITVTAISGGISTSATFKVVGAKLTSTPLPAVISPGASGRIDFRLVDFNSNPMSGQDIKVTGADGVVVEGTTSSNGDFGYNYVAPSSGGNIEILGNAGGDERRQTVQVTGAVIPIATPSVLSASLAAAPSVVPVNTAIGTSNRAELRALFIGPGNIPVKNVRVRFDLNGDANSVGGTISSGANVVYSDSNGVAASAYLPSTRFSPTDGLTVRACWSESDFPLGTCPNQSPIPTTATLTVISESFSVTIGTDNKIEEGPTKLDYVKRYLVQVNDASGLARAGVQVTPSVDLLRYFKGIWVVVGDTWGRQQSASCDNEDLNRNGILQVYPGGSIEDANSTGKLEPRKADVNISIIGSPSTNADGQVVLKITYPKNYGSWVEFNILAVASGVAGTEGRTNYQGVLPVSAIDVNDPDVPPPFVVSPYGISDGLPIVPTSTPEGQTGLLCTNPN